MKRTQDYINEELDRRKRRNPKYSLRSFARDLNLSVGLLSEIATGKKSMTLKMAVHFADALQIPPARRYRFIDTVLRESLEALKSKAQVGGAPHNKELLHNDQLRVIYDWYHFSILSLARTQGAKADPKWVAQRLSISPAEAQGALNRLKRLGLISLKKDELIRTSLPLETSVDIPSIFLKRSHHQTLEKTIQSLYEVPVTQREIMSTTVATSPQKLQEAKIMIRQFADKLADFLEDGPMTEVYNINIQLVPSTILNSES